MKETLGYSPSIISSSRKPLVTGGDARLSIAVLGKSCVGKTALTVQYLTGRFIGDYCSGQNMTYRTSASRLGGSFSTPVDILDTSNNSTAAHYDIESGRINEDSYWAAQHSQSVQFNSSEDKTSHHQHRQAYLVVYSLTDAASFDLAKEILQMLPSTAPKFLVANQLDLQHRRQVPREEGQALADRFDCCHFGEFSASNPFEDFHYGRHIKSAFGKLIRQLISSSPQCVLAPYFPRISFSVFSKLMSTLAVIKMRNKLRKMTLTGRGPSCFPINLVASSI